MLRQIKILLALAGMFILVSCNGGGSSGTSSSGGGGNTPTANGVSLSTPFNGSIGVAVKPTLSFQFNESVVQSSVSILLNQDSTSGTAISGVTEAGLTNQYTFLPNDNLVYGKTYYVQVSASGVDGTNLTGSFSFTVMDTPPDGSSSTSGTIYYHGYLPQTSTSGFEDNMTLTNNGYTDAIISNYIAGAMLGHLIEKAFPGIHYIRDYIFGTMYGQWLQENLDSSLYVSTSNLLAPSALQVGVMGIGEGGPYQINDYYVDMVGGSYVPAGHSLSNYVALQKHIGYTLFVPGESQASQVTKATPAQFNDKFFSPMITAYFHINDLLSLESLDTGTSGPAPQFNNCMAKFVDMPNAPLDVIVNYAYNQGYYGDLVPQFVTNCMNMSESAFLAMYNGSYDMANGEGGESSSYTQYPYQVRFYLDELSNSSTLSPTTTNNLSFSMQELRNVFTYVFQTISYVNSSNQYLTITPDQAGTAFDAALSTDGVSISTVLNMSDNTQRGQVFDILATAISALETNLGADFLQISLTQLQ